MPQLSRRQFLAGSAAAGAALTVGRPKRAHALANDEISLGFISCGGRANEHMGTFSGLSGLNIAGLCDPDESRLAAAKKRFPKAQGWPDMRALIEDKSIDAVVVATTNHWHCLAAIWAMEAGKHVYVEKPLSHSQWEGRQTVAAAAKYKKVCAIGTQQRSDPMQAEIKDFLHKEKALGAIQSARVNRYGIRGPIGKRDTPLPISANVNYDLWLGPAQDLPIYRDKLQYDWHWDWNTGSGEMGNWGVHVLDDCRNNIFQDSVTLPKKIFGGGGRVVWNDAGQTPNVHFVYFDTGSIPVVIGLSNLPKEKGSKDSPAHPGPGSGYIAYCEGGRLEGQRGSAVALDKDGKVIKKFKGNAGGSMHHQNFLDAVRRNDSSGLNASIKVGHDSTGWCNLANIAFRAGSQLEPGNLTRYDDPSGIWGSLVKEMEQHMAGYSLKLDETSMMLSPVLTVDVEKEVFVGDHAESANKFLRREYRAPYVVPEITA
jgi:predicted dehydrogenase